jgi:hypothetical protein
MWEKIQIRIFPFLIAFSALSVSASAAFYSISGLSKLFAGAAFAVIIMAASLEIAKLVIASLLYQYRKNLPKLLKYYLSIACVILILITSMGIYGFLSAAYQETAAKAGNIEAEIALVEVKRDNVKEQLIVYNEEKTSINGAVADLRKGLSNNVIQYKDRETGEIITTTSSNTRRALEKQLDQAIERQTQINTKVDELNEKIFEYETEIVEIRTSDAVSSELGPLKYLSGLTGTPMDKIINWLLLTIIFVFDPLAIALVVAANFAFEQIRPKTRKNLYGETVKVKPNPEPLYEENDERMNIIGQNGNDGHHYEVKMSKPDDLEYGKPYTMEEVSEAFKKMDEQIEEEAKEEKFADSYTHTGYASEEIKELEDQLNKLPKTKKLGPKGRKALTKKLNELKNKKNDDDDLIIRY